ncbi:Hypothetical predicted protein [Pelobates cultripes]|uniref:Uncharacterized protein n=1 Tax=Pelobates cultripes TaxID=61616 RepID=A0AAD1RQY5_PELCU|nr:Hypothetical predicted protein [Pelobates cultripes]
MDAIQGPSDGKDHASQDVIAWLHCYFSKKAVMLTVWKLRSLSEPFTEMSLYNNVSKRSQNIYTPITFCIGGGTPPKEGLQTLRSWKLPLTTDTSSLRLYPHGKE